MKRCAFLERCEKALAALQSRRKTVFYTLYIYSCRSLQPIAWLPSVCRPQWTYERRDILVAILK
jgi:hypothetical protein